MASDLQTRPGVPKYEAFVEQQLGKVRQRIRWLDVGRSALLLLVVTLAYFLLMACFDMAVGGGDSSTLTAVRLAGFGLYLLAVGFLLVQLATRLYRRINPYYAARQLEQALDDPKNSVINWLDLKDEELPGAIRNAVGLRAARTLKQADPEQVVETKGNWLLTGVLVALVLGILVVFALGPNRFGSLVSRVFAPFRDVALANRAEITLLKPADGDVTIPLQQRLEFQARIEGRFPKINHEGAPRLLFRYQKADSYVAIPLEEALDGTWGATLSPDQIQNGFWYKVAAGDAETPEYQVKVQALAQATKFEATYKFRPYLKLPELTERYPNAEAVLPHIKGHRGTEVTLVVRANRHLREGRVEIEANGVKTDLVGELMKDDPQALRVKWTLAHSGVFRVFFKSVEGEPNTDRSVAYPISVLDDQTPRVTLTVPGKNVELPANGTLELAGDASDDVGIKSLALRLKLVEGGDRVFEPKLFREGKSLQFDNGTYPAQLEYKELVFLDKLKASNGQPFPLKAGMVLEYWLEATDNSDFPNPDGNVGKSVPYKVAILEPKKDDPQQKKEREQAQQKQKEFEKQQDAKHAAENQARNEDAKKAPQQGDAAKNDPEKQKQQEKLEKELKDKADKLNEALNKDKEPKKDEKTDKGQAKGSDPAKCDCKQGGGDKNGQQAASKDAKVDQGNQPGEKKEGQQQAANDQPGQAKDDGAKGSGQPKQEPNATAKGPGQDKAQAEPKSKDGKKEANTPENKQAKGASKDGQSKDGMAEKAPAQAKNEGGKGEEKPAAAKGAPDKGTSEKAGPDKQGGEKSVAKGSEEGPPKGDAKGAEGMDGGPQQAPAAAKKSDGPPKDQGSAKGAAPEQAKDSGVAKGDRAEKAENAHAQQPKRDFRNATAKDLENLKDQLKKELEQPGKGDEALDDLAELAKQAKDPNVRKAAEELIRDMAPGQPKAKGAKGPNGAQEDVAKGTPKDSGGQPQGEPSGEAKTGQPQGTAQGKGQEDGPMGEATAKKGQFGGSGKNGAGIADKLKETPANELFSKKGGELQLEDLKKRITPEVLKKAGLTDADWQQFLKDAQAYNEMLRQQAKAKPGLTQKGTTSKLGSLNPQEVKTDPNAVLDPLQSGRALPPPEFRLPQKRFTTQPKN